MKAFRTGHYFLALFFTGFLTGILIVNYIWGEQLSLIGTFTEVFLMRLKNETISFQQYIWYLILWIVPTKAQKHKNCRNIKKELWK